MEAGQGNVGRVDVNFLSGPSPVAAFLTPSVSYAEEKRVFAATRRRRWFGHEPD
jgi:sulfide:quinone oxidoreductase